MIELLYPLPWPALAAFLTAGLALNLAPGADVLFAVTSGLRGGPVAGVAAGVGTGLGSLAQTLLAALGLAALVAAEPSLLSGIRWLGAGWLLLLAWRSWDAGGTTPSGAPDGGATGLTSALRGAFVTNLFNPKTLLFTFAFLTQFADPALGPVGWQILGLGLLFAATGTLVTAGYGLTAGLAGGALGARLSLLNRVAALVFVALALRLIWT